MKASIIIVSWNAAKYLSDCIKSIIRQISFLDTEVIVVDNASTDGSPELVGKEYPEVRLIKNYENLGFAKANNIGIRSCSGEYIFFINSDVEVKLNCIQSMISYMEDHPIIGLLGPKVLSANGTTQRSCMYYPTLWNTFCRMLALDSLFPKSRLFSSYMMTSWSHNDVSDVEVINGCFWLVRRKALNSVGLLDERFFIYAEDIDWCKRFQKAGWKIVFYPGAEIIHYGGASSSNDPVKFNIEKEKANIQLWEKYQKKKGKYAYFTILYIHNILRIIGFSIYKYIAPQNRAPIDHKIQRSMACIHWLHSGHIGK
jgi:GT2 family glycosyltransferase